jgi:hypothetical protein
MRLPSLLLVISLGAACQREPEPTEPPPASSVQAASTVTSTFVAGSSPVAALGGAMSPSSEELSMGGDLQNPDTTRASVEADASANLAGDPSCVTVTWGEGLRATVQFTNCLLVATGELLNGSLSLELRLNPVTISVTAASLTAGARSIDGTASLSLAQTTPQVAFQVGADLTLDGGDHQLTLTALRLTVSRTGLVLDGSARVEVPASSIDASVSPHGMTFAAGDCLPSSGTLDFDDGTLSGTVTFFATTPSTGIVSVQITGFIPVDVMLPPCS